MGKFISPRAALIRVVEDDEVPTQLRIKALEQIPHPPLCMMRRLIAETAKRVTPVPPKLKAIATMAYVREVAFRKLKAAAKVKAQQDGGNALGI